MKRLRSMVFALVVAGLAVGTALPASAAANLPRLGDGLPEVAQEIGKLFSPELMNALNLDSSQRNSFDELRRRGFGDRRDDGRDYREVRRDDRRYDRYDSRSLGRLYDVIDVGRRGYRGSYRFERDDDDGLEAFLAILSLGLMMSNRSPGYGYGYPDPYPYGYGYPDGYYYGGYGYDMIQLEDFLYLFYQILNLNQRQTFRVYFDRWYDDSYYYPRYHGRYDWDRYDGRDGCTTSGSGSASRGTWTRGSSWTTGSARISTACSGISTPGTATVRSATSRWNGTISSAAGTFPARSASSRGSGCSMPGKNSGSRIARSGKR